MKLFIDRLLFVGKMFTMLIFIGGLLALAAKCETNFHGFHLSSAAQLIIAWVGIIILGGLLLTLACLIIYGLIRFFIWLFIEPFRDKKTER